jgi:hypothetical protein
MSTKNRLIQKFGELEKVSTIHGATTFSLITLSKIEKLCHSAQNLLLPCAWRHTERYYDECRYP